MRRLRAARRSSPCLKAGASPGILLSQANDLGLDFFRGMDGAGFKA
jgi:hypothetical protein